MSTGEDKKFYSSRAWREARRKALLNAGFKSSVDGTIMLKGAHVDHILHRKLSPELALDVLNLRVLTPGQHNQRHAKADYDPARRGCDTSGWPKGPQHPWNLMRRKSGK